MKWVPQKDHEFSDDCPHCRPALYDMQTGLIMADDHPMMVIVNKVWKTETTFAERRAFIEVTLKNSQNPVDRQHFQSVSQKITDALRQAEKDGTI